MKHTMSLFGALALVGVLMLPSHSILADETKTTETKTETATATTTAAAPNIIGKVTYLLGQAELTLADGIVEPITRQTEISEGSTVSVKDHSKLNLLMVDGETEKLPANSTLTFTKYKYDPNNPGASEVSKEFTEGGITTKTGAAGHYAPERYRLNSPLAAIAVLGTEYTVQLSEGETRVTVIAGEISMAKLGGSCLRSGLGVCSGGERLSEDQRGLALVVRKDEPRPILIPVSEPPPKSKTQVQAAPAEETSKTADAKADKTAADKKADKQETAEASTKSDGKATEVATEKSTEKAAEKVADKSTEKTTEKTTEKLADKTVEKVVDKTTAEKVVADKTKDKTTDTKTAEVTQTVDERNALAELDTTTKTASNTPAPLTPTPTVTPQVDERDALATATIVSAEIKASAPASIATPAVPAATVPPLATNTLASASGNTTLQTPTSTLESDSGKVLTTGTSAVTTPVTTSVISSSPIGGSSLLVSSGTGTSTSLGGASNDLLESNKGGSTVTTDAGEVIPVVTPPPVVTPEPAVSTSLPVVRLGKYDPATIVGDSATLGDLVSSQYEQLIAGTVAGDNTIERLKVASPTLPEQRDVSLLLDSYEASVRNATAGTQTTATITDATLNVSSARNTFDTGFTLNSPEYVGSVKATGTYGGATGLLKDDGTNPQTTINGAVGVLGEKVGAAYTFTHQIDPTLSASGALSWAGTLAAEPVVVTPEVIMPEVVMPEVVTVGN
ncbi:FecR domain-containing protein [Thiothrix litoralis]|uniref:FecR domain-containing protein n=2 Tax=Thiothrix litoralis TaxID=2891210 RepID=A0ABX7WQ96_9GAMM|nr:FecR domain-containing protein [Thiothrix litoralis]QTR46031.1 FecR domain-containing protein [Thiothrix litoralis]